MLGDAIRAILEQATGELSNEEVASRIVAGLPPEMLAEALLEALPPLVSNYKSRINRQALSPVDPVGGATRSGSLRPGGQRFASHRAALLADRLLAFNITGVGNRHKSLAQANLADVRYEADISRRRGETFLGRAEIFEDMIRQMASEGVTTPRGLRPEIREAYARRLAGLLGQPV